MSLPPPCLSRSVFVCLGRRFYQKACREHHMVGRTDNVLPVGAVQDDPLRRHPPPTATEGPTATGERETRRENRGRPCLPEMNHCINRLVILTLKTRIESVAENTWLQKNTDTPLKYHNHSDCLEINRGLMKISPKIHKFINHPHCNSGVASEKNHGLKLFRSNSKNEMIPWLKKAPKRNEIIDVTLQFPYCWNGRNPHH